MISIKKLLINSKNFKHFFHQLKLQRKQVFKLYQSSLPLRIVNDRCAISKKNKFIYFRISKAANSTVISTLKYACDRIKAKTQYHIRQEKKNYIRFSDLSDSEANEVIREYWKFTVVRNPYDRFLSAYLDKILGNRPPKKQVSNYLGLSPDNQISIDDFLTYLEYGGIYENPHWAIQTDLIFIPLKKLNFVGKVETLQADMKFITKKIFGKEIEIKDWRPHATEAENKREQILNSESKKRIYKIYQKDFDSFLYKKI
jgi:dermatan 4-sulfotransferase 1